MRAFLGYSTVENAGIILVGLGVAAAGPGRSQTGARRRRPAGRHPPRLRPQSRQDTRADRGRPDRARLGGHHDGSARRSRTPTADHRRRDGHRIAHPRCDPATRRVRERVVHLPGVAAGLPDADPALRAALRAGRRGARPHRRPRSARLREVLRHRLPGRVPHLKRRARASRRGGPADSSGSPSSSCFSARSLHGRSTPSPPRSAPMLGIHLATTTISYPLVLTPVFVGFSVLDPTWLSLTLPVYVVLCLHVVAPDPRAQRAITAGASRPGLGDRVAARTSPRSSIGPRPTPTRCGSSCADRWGIAPPPPSN